MDYEPINSPYFGLNFNFLHQMWTESPTKHVSFCNTYRFLFNIVLHQGPRWTRFDVEGKQINKEKEDGGMWCRNELQVPPPLVQVSLLLIPIIPFFTYWIADVFFKQGCQSQFQTYIFTLNDLKNIFFKLWIN